MTGVQTCALPICDPSPVIGPALDDPRELVPEHQWMRELRVTDAAVGKPMQVRTTQTNRCHANESLALALGRLKLFGDTHISHTVKPCHPHGRLTDQGFPGAKTPQRGATPQMLGGTPPATAPATRVAIPARSSVLLRLLIDLDPRPKLPDPFLHIGGPGTREQRCAEPQTTAVASSHL